VSFICGSESTKSGNLQEQDYVFWRCMSFTRRITFMHLEMFVIKIWEPDFTIRSI